MVMREVRAALLAGGRGERMGRLTERLCKPLVPYAGACRLVDFSLANCVRSGVPELVLMSQHRERDLIDHLLGYWDDRLRVSFGPHDKLVRADPAAALPERPDERGTADALLANAEWVFAPGARDVLILHADHVYSMDYEPLVRRHRETGADVTIGVQRIARRFVPLFGMVEVDVDGKVSRLVEKPATPTSDLVFTAFSVFRRDVLREVLGRLDARPADEWEHDISRDVLPYMIERDYDVRAFPVRDYWADIGTVERYHLGHLYLLRVPGAMAEELPTLPGALGEVPRTLPGASPSIAGNHVLTSSPVPLGAEVRDSVLYPGCLIEPGARVQRSVVLPGARVRATARVSGTVILENETITGIRTGLSSLR